MPFGSIRKLRAAKKIIDRIGNQLITERKSALVREQSYGAKEKTDTSGKDLLTLLVRANLQDADGMSDSDVRARKCSLVLPLLLHITTVSSRDMHLPRCWPRDNEYCYVVDPIRAVSEPRSTGKTPRRAFGSRHGGSDYGRTQVPSLPGHGRS